MIVPIQDIKKPQTAKQYWRSASQIANTAKFQDWMHREFPVGASELPEGSSRRNLLKFMGATLALAGLTACRRPEEKIYPLVRGAEDLVPGKPVYYNSVFSMSGTAAGIMVETHDGRPTKIEGNPNHPHSLGAASTYAQASILGLYDPDRIAKHTKDGNAVEWKDFVAAVPTLFSGDGSKLRFLSQRIASPSYARLKGETLKKFPGARWVEYEPIQADGAREGARIAFGRPVSVNYNFEAADVILSLDFDFLGLDGSTLLNARQWAARRRVRDSHHASMNRVYVAESQFSVTGGAADHRVRMRASDILAFTTALAAKLGIGVTAPSSVPDGEDAARVLDVLAKDLQAHQGKCLVAAGPRQPAAVHALALLINQTLGNIGTSVQLLAVPDTNSEVAQLKQLVDDLNAGAVETVVVIGGNPVYDAPADFEFGAAYSKAANRIYHGEDNNETAAASTWVLQGAHYMECWGDAANFDGVVAIQQPMILPLFDGKSPLELLAAITGAEKQRGYEIVQETWLPTLSGDKQKAWRKIVHDGVIPGTTAPTVSASVNSAAVLQAVSAAPAAGDGLELVFVPSSHCYDGRFNNNAWLQEAPDPITKLTWDNAALISKATAEKLGIAEDIYQLETTTPTFTAQFVTIKHGDAEIRIPILIQPGHADDSITLTLGFGRQKTGQVGEGTGFNVYPLRKSTGMSIATGATVTKSSGRYELASTQDHGSLTDVLRTRTEIVRELTLEEFQKDHHAFHHLAHELPEFQLYESPKYESPYQWGMTVDLNTCFGCNACLVACQSENNIPTVGKSQVLMGREMHWIRMDRYYTGSVEEAQMVSQPMACQHCETAPCENVCPVAATVHGPDGTNQMAYNRCVGTRYCSNNCPYKVRRFNFFDYHNKRYDWFTLGNKAPEIASLQYNPDVTVRERGIMEKCTYCIQRIAQVRIQAKTENREIRDGEIQTACQQTCPSQAIEFGNVADPNSRVSQTKKLDANYAVLQELNVRPRTTYLGRLRNPHPELV
jgi:MoCo/4Fe-4S cofactor protein with predicted Tat translocation signal